jgi:hypothetical protein
MDQLEAIAGRPGVLELNGKTYTINPPTPQSQLQELLQMREFAQKECQSPIDYAAKHTHLPTEVFTLLMREAIKLGSNPLNMKPTEDAIREMYGKLAPTKWRIRFHINRSGGTISDKELDWVNESNMIECINKLDSALRLEDIAEGKPQPPIGSNS